MCAQYYRDIDDARPTRRTLLHMRELGAGVEIAGYCIEAVAGRGGMGIVYRARQSRPQRTVAIKVISPDLAADPGFRRRFEQESTTAAQIEHPNVIPVYEVGEQSGLLFIVMRFVEGVDLGELLARSGRLEPLRAARLAAQVADALDAAHAYGLVHRDVKPGNVLVAANDHVYLTDFGLSKRIVEASGLTKSGMFVGTVAYAAPEQIEAREIDARADVYALGCMTYQLLAGTVPFPRDSDLAVLFGHVNDPPPRLGSVPAPLADAVERAMAKSPEHRFRSAGEFGRAVLAGAASRARPSLERTAAMGTATIDRQGAGADRRAPGATEAAWPRESADIVAGGALAAPSYDEPRPSSDARGRRRAWVFAAAGAPVVAMIAAGVALAVGGSTGSSPTPRVVGTIKTALTAVATGNGSIACAQLTGSTQRHVAESVGTRTCADAVKNIARILAKDPTEKQNLLQAEVRHVRIDRNKATADLLVGAATHTLGLAESGGRWLISTGNISTLTGRGARSTTSTTRGSTSGGSTTLSTTTAGAECILTIDFPYARIYASPGYSTASGVDVPAGSYPAITSQVLPFAGLNIRWYEISVGGRQGWIPDDGPMIASKSSACPLS